MLHRRLFSSKGKLMTMMVGTNDLITVMLMLAMTMMMTILLRKMKMNEEKDVKTCTSPQTINEGGIEPGLPGRNGVTSCV